MTVDAKILAETNYNIKLLPEQEMTADQKYNRELWLSKKTL